MNKLHLLLLLFLLSTAWVLLFLLTAWGQSQSGVTVKGLHGRIAGSHVENSVTQTLVFFDFGKYGMYLCEHEEHDPVKALDESCCLQPLKTAVKTFAWTNGLAENYITQKDSNIQTNDQIVVIAK